MNAALKGESVGSASCWCSKSRLVIAFLLVITGVSLAGVIGYVIHKEGKTSTIIISTERIHDAMFDSKFDLVLFDSARSYPIASLVPMLFLNPNGIIDEGF